jgi:hypothetical protein
MAHSFTDMARRVIALADIAEAVDRFQQGESNVDETMERIAGVVARLTVEERHRPVA